MKVGILAGGSGTRLWPLSRKLYPKQFLKLGGNDSFLQKTIRRKLKICSAEDIFIVTSPVYFQDVLRQAKEIDPALEKNIVLEPAQKNTAPATALLVKHLLDRGTEENELLFITPADHLIAPEERFVDSVLRGTKILDQQSGIVTFGIRPHRPETGYGYIKAQGEKVEAFVEKPDHKTACRYVEEGIYYWNSGMFLFKLKTFIEEVKALAPEIAPIFQEAAHFGKAPNISLDYAIMEKSKKSFMLPLDLSWSDVGSWDNVYEMLPKDEHQNATMGPVELFDTKETLVISNKPIVATIGVEELLIVATDDVVLVAKKEESQKVKAVVERLKIKGRKEVDEHATIYRPWGSYTVLEEGERYKMKRIIVHPLHKLSLQLHYHRSEHWVVVKGTARVTVNEQETVVHEGQSIFVPKSAVHRVENPGKVPLEIIEVQVGEYLGEDDIVRLEDVYGRLKSPT